MGFHSEFMESNCDIVGYHAVCSAKLVNITRFAGDISIRRWIEPSQMGIDSWLVVGKSNKTRPIAQG